MHQTAPTRAFQRHATTSPMSSRLLLFSSVSGVGAALAIRAEYMAALLAGSDVVVCICMPALTAHPWCLPRKEVTQGSYPRDSHC
jgi:hypothetical protein